MTFRVLDPTAGEGAAGRPARAAPATLEGKTVGFISNGKEGTKGFFSASRPDAARGARRGQGREPHQVQLQRAGRRPHRGRDQEWDAVISGIGD